MQTTWDGLPVSDAPPFGATVVVFRVSDDGLEVLMLHRAHLGPGYAGDWAWTPPAGARLPGEPVEECARRELREETGLVLPLELTSCGSDEWSVYLAEASSMAGVVIDAEYDRFEWLPITLATTRCTPDLARAPLVAAIAQIRQRFAHSR
jgi:8-oxo-dGTP pyrophosphatase MutT (NUDIX family)